MIARDWRRVPPSTIATIRDEDLAYWRSTLCWNASVAWERMESARAAGLLPGVIVEAGDGRVAGWSFYLLHEGSLQIGALVSHSSRTTDVILDRLLNTPEADRASDVILFAPARAADTIRALERHSFSVEPYHYLHRRIAAADAVAVGRPWRSEDRQALADLFASAYAGSGDVARPFARTGTADAWLEYVDQLTATQGCGDLLAGHSIVVPSADGARLDAAIVVTRLDAHVAHVAQCVVDPRAAGCGLGRRAMGTVEDALARDGFTRLTLLVGESNRRARVFYRGLGFERLATFVSAVRDQPRRLTSAAFDTGGASTLR